MLETRAVVTRLEGTEALVEAVQGGGCGQCSAGGCGSGKLSQVFCVHPRQFRVRNDIHAAVGEEVQVAVADGTVLRSALILYGLPLLLLFGGALCGAHWLGGIAGRDAGAAVGAVGGLLAGLVLARLIASRQRTVFAASPVISRCESMKKSAIL